MSGPCARRPRASAGPGRPRPPGGASSAEQTVNFQAKNLEFRKLSQANS